MYSEDADICYRFRKIGLKNYYIASNEIVHIRSGSSERTDNSKLFESWFFKSRRLYFKKKSFFEYWCINLFYVSGGIFRIFIGSMTIIFRCFIMRKMNKLAYYKSIIIKYARILLLGLNIDIIGSS